LRETSYKKETKILKKEKEVKRKEE